MRKWLYFLFTALVFSSCSGDDDDMFGKGDDGNGDDGGSGNAENELFVLNLNVKEDQKNIFDLVEFGILPEKSITLAGLREHYDSLVWKVSGLEGSHKVFEYTDYSSSLSFKWSHNFFLPGDYETYLLGYKDDKVIYGDTMSVKIVNDKDFLGYNWKDIEGSIGHSVGYVDVLLEDKNKVTYQDMHQNTPSVELSLWLNGHQDEQAFIRESEKMLSDYITSLYSSPTYDLTDDALLEKYNSLFTYKKESAYPQCIWLTPKSKIVLLKCYDNIFTDYFVYRIYAEPGEGI